MRRRWTEDGVTKDVTEACLLPKRLLSTLDVCGNQALISCRDQAQAHTLKIHATAIGALWGLLLSVIRESMRSPCPPSVIVCRSTLFPHLCAVDVCIVVRACLDLSRSRDAIYLSPNFWRLYLSPFPTFLLALHLLLLFITAVDTIRPRPPLNTIFCVSLVASTGC